MGFGSLLGKIGSALPVVGPFVAPIAAGLLSRSGPSDAEKTVLANQAAAQKIGMGIAGPLAAQGAANSGLASDYWGKILSGNKASATAAAAPDLLRIGEGYDTAARTSAALSPRGGPSAEFLAEQPFAKQRDVALALGGQRSDAAGKVAQVGSSQLANAIQALYGSSAAGREIINSEQFRKVADAKRGEEIGAGLFDVLSKYGDKGGKNMFSGLMDLIHKHGTKYGTPDLPAGFDANESF